MRVYVRAKLYALRARIHTQYVRTLVQLYEGLQADAGDDDGGDRVFDSFNGRINALQAALRPDVSKVCHTILVV